MVQSKRTNVGIALVSSPRVLFLDEPTSGLDSYTSSEVMEVVQVCALGFSVLTAHTMKGTRRRLIRTTANPTKIWLD